MATLEDICLPVEKVKPQEEPEKMFTYLDISSIDNLRWRVVTPKVFAGKNAPSRARQKVRRGSILFSTVRTYLKNVAMVPPEYDGQVASTGFCVLYPADRINGRFVLYYVLSEEFISRLNPLQRGTSYPAVRDSDVLSQELRLSPLPEQHRIVAEIDKQFTRLDASEAALKRAQANLRRYRASVLKAACEGKLVSTEAALAQAEGRDYEPADQLLERILAERRARWKARGKKKGKYKEPVAPDTSDLSDLPDGWVWSGLDQLAKVGTGSTPLKSNRKFYHEGDIPWVTSSALNDPIISSPIKFVTEQAVRECKLVLYPPNTLLIAMYGEGKTRGKCSELLFQSTINQAIAALTLPDSAVDCRSFIRLFLTRNYEETRRLSSGGVQPNLNLGIIRQIAIPLPPLAEQERIVLELERHLSIIQQAEATVEVSLKRVERLRQGILKQAFSGQLVPQDPNDEPAAVLLERIRAERAASEAVSPGKKKTRRRRSKTSPDKQIPLLESAP